MQSNLTNSHFDAVGYEIGKSRMAGEVTGRIVAFITHFTNMD